MIINKKRKAVYPSKYNYKGLMGSSDFTTSQNVKRK